MSNEDLKTRRRAHDVKEAVKTLRMAVEDLSGGYRFDDQFAEEKIKMLHRVVEILEAEIDEWSDHLRDRKE